MPLRRRDHRNSRNAHRSRRYIRRIKSLGRYFRLGRLPSFKRFGRVMLNDTWSMVRIAFIAFVVICVPVIFLATSREKETLLVAGSKIGRVIVNTATGALDRIDRMLFRKAKQKFPKEKRR